MPDVQKFDKAKRFSVPMEIFYILGRYYIDIAMMAGSLKGQEPVLVQAGLMKPGQTIEEFYKQMIDEGVVTLQTDLYMNPNYKWAHNNLGVLYDRLRDFPRSREAYRRVLAIDQEQIYAHYNLGLGHLMEGRLQEAIDEFQLALVVDPSRTELYRFLARAFVNSKDYTRAMRAADKFLSLTLLQNLMNPYLAGNFPAEAVTEIRNSISQGNLNQALDTYIPYHQLVLNDTGGQYKDLHQVYLQIAHDLAVAQSIWKPRVAILLARS